MTGINSTSKFTILLINLTSKFTILLPIFQKCLLNFIRHSENRIFNIHNKVAIKLLTLWLGFSHLHPHKSRDNFVDNLNILCFFSIKPETAIHFFLWCHFYCVIWANLMSDLLNIDSSLPTENDEKLLDILLYGNSKFNTIINQNILICTLKFIKYSHRFDRLLFKGT